MNAILNFKHSNCLCQKWTLSKRSKIVYYIFKNGPTPVSFPFIFSLFNQLFTILQRLSSIRRRDSNSQPSEHESPPITTRPGLKLLLNINEAAQVQIQEVANCCFNISIYITILLGSGCVSVGRSVASDSRGLRFESSHQQNLYWTFTVNCIDWRT